MSNKLEKRGRRRGHTKTRQTALKTLEKAPFNAGKVSAKAAFWNQSRRQKKKGGEGRMNDIRE